MRITGINIQGTLSLELRNDFLKAYSSVSIRDGQILVVDDNFRFSPAIVDAVARGFITISLQDEDEVVQSEIAGLGSPAGADTEVQFNNSGIFGASSGFTFNSGSFELTVSGQVKTQRVIALDGVTRIDFSSATPTTIYEENSSNTLAIFGSTGIYIQHNAVRIRDGGGNDRMEFLSVGNPINIYANFFPSSDNTWDIGSSSFRFRDGYFAGKLTVDGLIDPSGLLLTDGTGETPVAGLLIWDSMTAKFKGCLDGSTFEELLTTASGLVSGADTEVQFNDSGALGADSTFTFDAGGNKELNVRAAILGTPSAYWPLQITDGTDTKFTFLYTSPGMQMAASVQLLWGSGASSFGPADVGLARLASASLKVTNGGLGTGSLTAASYYDENSNQLLNARKTGWSAPTGTATRTTFSTATVTTTQLAERVKALIDDLTSHGLIGA